MRGLEAEPQRILRELLHVKTRASEATTYQKRATLPNMLCPPDALGGRLCRSFESSNTIIPAETRQTSRTSQHWQDTCDDSWVQLRRYLPETFLLMTVHL